MPLPNAAAKVDATLAALSDFEKLAAATAGMAGFTPDKLEDMLASFADAFIQNNRLFSLKIGEGRMTSRLLPQTLEGEERLSETYRYEVTCLSPDAFIPLNSLLGQSAQLDIITGMGGADVSRCGLITKAEGLPSDGGFAKYQLTIEPPLAILRHRRTSRVFQDKSVPEIVAQILEEHRQANYAIARILALAFRQHREYPPRSYCLQHRESDLAFIERILFEEGLSYYFEHQAGDIPTVTFVVFDNPYSLSQATQGMVRFHRADATEAEDSLTEWMEDKKIGPNSASLASFDYKPVVTHHASAETRIERQSESSLEDYDAQALYYGKDFNDLTRYAQRRQEAHDWEKGGYTGQGNMRQLKVGEWFVLTQHPLHQTAEESEFLADALRFTAHNNLPGDLLRHLAPQEPDSKPYWVCLKAHKRGQPVAPAYAHTRHARPTAPGAQTATVVGPRDETEVYTDEMGRVKIQFHWQRPREHPAYGANFDERSSCWVRVVYPIAGVAWGSQYLPRIGQEVMVEFEEDDIDRPLIVGALHNGQQHNPWFSEAGYLPQNRTLSGIKTKEFYGEQYNELLFDDTQDQVRVKVSSEHGKTQTNQGYLIHPRKDGEGEPRGDGAELRTDHQLAVRAGEGLLLTTEAKPGAEGQQIDREQAQAQLHAARKTAETLGGVAETQLADAIEIGPETRDEEGVKGAKTLSGHLDHMVEAIDSWEAGTNTDPKGSTTTGGQTGRQPVLLVSSADGIGLVTPQEMVLTSGGNFDTVSQRDTQQTTVRRWIHNVGKKISLFVSGITGKVNLKLIAAKGHAQLYAQSGNVEVTGDQNVTISANKENLTAAAGEEFLVACGGAYIRIAGGKIDLHCPGTLSMKAGSHGYTGPTSLEKDLPDFPQTRFAPDEQGNSTDFSG